jgi:hypothetical protein
MFISTVRRRFHGNLIAYRPVAVMKQVKEKLQPEIYCIVSGLSKFSNRSDISKLVDEIKPLEIQCLVDRKFYRTGSWVLKFPDNSYVPEVNKFIDSQCANVITSYRWVEGSLITKFPLARMLGLNNRTIILRGVPLNITREHIQHLFEHYRIIQKSIKLVSRDGQYLSYVAEFTSPEQAKRVCIESSPLAIEGVDVSLHWYDI